MRNKFIFIKKFLLDMNVDLLSRYSSDTIRLFRDMSMFSFEYIYFLYVVCIQVEAAIKAKKPRQAKSKTGVGYGDNRGCVIILLTLGGVCLAISLCVEKSSKKQGKIHK